MSHVNMNRYFCNLLRWLFAAKIPFICVVFYCEFCNLKKGGTIPN